MSKLKNKLQSLEAYLERVMREHEIPGLAIAITRGDDVVYARGFGKRDAKGKYAVDEQTVFGIASITKSFTALAIIQLVEHGKLSLDDPVIKHLPNFRLKHDDTSKITIEHLLAHTSGLPLTDAVLKATGVPGGKQPDITLVDKLLDYMLNEDVGLLAEPGRYVSYSNEGYAMLGRIVECVSGKRYEEYVRENILQPLGMTSATFDSTNLKNKDNVTSLFELSKEGRVTADDSWPESPAFTAAGFLKTNLVDLAKYGRMYVNNGLLNGRRIVSAHSLNKMTECKYGFMFNSWYGYGLCMEKDYAQGVTLVRHGGGFKGISSHFGYIQEKKISVSVVCNIAGAPAEDIWMAAVNAMLGLPLNNPRIDYNQFKYQWSEEEINSLCGDYHAEGGFDVHLVDLDGKLASKTNNGYHIVRPLTADAGLVKMMGKDTEICFLRNSNGYAWAVKIMGRILPCALQQG